jgi:hypothetical protein
MSMTSKILRSKKLERFNYKIIRAILKIWSKYKIKIKVNNQIKSFVRNKNIKIKINKRQ